MTDFSPINNELVSVWPEVLAETIDENSVELNLFVPKQLDFFKGHFPSTPILAGVVQLHWAVEYAKNKLIGFSQEVVNLEVLKFQVVIVPEQHLVLTLTKKTATKVLFSYHSEKGQHASGRIVFEEQS